MIRRITIFFFISLTLTQIQSLSAQTFDGEWKCDYATYDTDVNDNAIAQSCISIAAFSENTFVALSHRVPTATIGITNFLVGYKDADSAKGRMGTHYGGRGDRQLWSSGFDAVEMYQAFDVAVHEDLIFVANNDPARNILVFKLGADSVESSDYRMATQTDSIWAISTDASGRVYVSAYDPATSSSKILVYGSVANEAEWGGTHLAEPISVIDILEKTGDTGLVRGIGPSADGSVVYVSNFDTKKIYAFTGNPNENNYQLNNGFNFTLDDTFIASSGVDTLDPGPWGLGLMPEKNILFVACDVSFRLGVGYEYGRIYLLNPNTGEMLDTIDVADWNFKMTGAYNTRLGGNSPGNASGYTSTYNVSFDENFNLYSQSYYGWTVEKWSYTGTLPTIPLTIVSVRREETPVPNEFSLSQNYPNPFNPITTIEFSLSEDSEISLSVYTITGELVTDLINSSHFTKGNYKLAFDASKLASGTYIYTLKSGSKVLSNKMTLIK